VETPKAETPAKPACWCCGESIPNDKKKARRCNKCSAYLRGWRKHWVPLASTIQMVAWLAAVLAGIGGAGPFILKEWINFIHRNSQTSVAYAGVDVSSNEVILYAHLWNRGRLRPSTVGSYHLLLGNIHVADRVIYPILYKEHEVRSILDPGTDFTVPLIIPGLEAKDSFSYNAVLASLEHQKVTFCADVTESDGIQKCVESPPFDAELLTDAIQRRLGGKR
jgi:hypothetical protein